LLKWVEHHRELGYRSDVPVADLRTKAETAENQVKRTRFWRDRAESRRAANYRFAATEDQKLSDRSERIFEYWYRKGGGPSDQEIGSLVAAVSRGPASAAEYRLVRRVQDEKQHGDSIFLEEFGQASILDQLAPDIAAKLHADAAESAVRSAAAFPLIAFGVVSAHIWSRPAGVVLALASGWLLWVSATAIREERLGVADAIVAGRIETVGAWEAELMGKTHAGDISKLQIRLATDMTAET